MWPKFVAAATTTAISRALSHYFFCCCSKDVPNENGTFHIILIWCVYTFCLQLVRNEPAKHLNSLTSYSVASFARAGTTTSCPHVTPEEKSQKEVTFGI